jgi:hypothetical protein
MPGTLEAAITALPVHFDSDRAQCYAQQHGHGLILPGEPSAWTIDMGHSSIGSRSTAKSRCASSAFERAPAFLRA